MSVLAAAAARGHGGDTSSRESAKRWVSGGPWPPARVCEARAPRTDETAWSSRFTAASQASSPEGRRGERFAKRSRGGQGPPATKPHDALVVGTTKNPNPTTVHVVGS